jgi:ketosteroid isomerase-like protein
MGNAEVARRGYDSWSRQAVDEMLSLVTEDFVMKASGIFPGTDDEYRGRDEFARYMSLMVEPWEQFVIEVVRLIETGDDQVVGFARFHGRGRDGIELQREVGHVIAFRDGLASRVQSYESWDEALAAAGVTE